MNKTFIPTSKFTTKKWYIIDCKEKKLGRIASFIVSILSGKLKSYYYPSLDIGDYLILINVKCLLLDKNIQKLHVFCPGRPGKSLKKVLNTFPQHMIQKCINCMMPEGKAKKNLPTRLKIYQGSEHPHIAQNPILLNNF